MAFFVVTENCSKGAVAAVRSPFASSFVAWKPNQQTQLRTNKRECDIHDVHTIFIFFFSWETHTHKIYSHFCTYSDMVRWSRSRLFYCPPLPFGSSVNVWMFGGLTASTCGLVSATATSFNPTAQQRMFDRSLGTMHRQADIRSWIRRHLKELKIDTATPWKASRTRIRKFLRWNSQLAKTGI